MVQQVTQVTSEIPEVLEPYFTGDPDAGITGIMPKAQELFGKGFGLQLICMIRDGFWHAYCRFVDMWHAYFDPFFGQVYKSTHSLSIDSHFNENYPSSVVHDNIFFLQL